MKKLIETFKHIWSIEDLRKRIVYTLSLLVIYRLGSYVILPGIDSDALEGLNNQTKNNILGLINTFAGGAFGRGAIFALGIMPYISASIFMQLFSIAVPAFQRLQKEGEEGRRKINQYTRILTIAFTMVQAYGYLNNIASTPGNGQALLYNFTDVITPGMFMVSNMFLLTAGTMFTMWLGERITDRGLGNGISLLIMVGIIARLPSALLSELVFRFSDGFWHNAILIFLIVVFTYFYTAIIFNPVQMADDMKRNNGFIPGIKPGKQTANFIDGVISKITFPGAVFISLVAVMPVVAVNLKVNQEFSQFFGGTSLLILVGVVLDTLQQIDSYLLMRKYDGLMSGGGKLKGRMTNQYSQVDF